MKSCPHCAEKIQKGTKVCRLCQQHFDIQQNQRKKGKFSVGFLVTLVMLVLSFFSTYVVYDTPTVIAKEHSNFPFRNGERIYLKNMGHIDGPRWLDGRTANGTVGLAPTTRGGYTGTRWEVSVIGNNQISLKCLGHIDGSRWLDGRTANGTVGLAPTTRGGYTGTRWEVSVVGNNQISLKCMGHIDGPRWLDGRTANGTVGLAPTTKGGYTGTRWKVIRVKDQYNQYQPKLRYKLPQKVFLFQNGDQVYLKCMGHIDGPRWLDGRTANGTVGLAPTTKGGYTGTRWEVSIIGNNQISLKCMGHINGSRWLDGRTANGTVGLAPTTRGGYTGTRWEVSIIGNNQISLKCMGHIDGPRWLDGRTANGTVGLAPTTAGGYTGTRWKVIKAR
jgi:predicted nucleic acid-binding Zn ribbon protein